MPGPDEGAWKIALRRLELMFWSLICPEMIICWACRQWLAARKLRDEYGGALFGIPELMSLRGLTAVRAGMDKNTWLLSTDGGIYAHGWRRKEGRSHS